MSPARLDRWLSSVGYRGGISSEVLFTRLVHAAPGLARAAEAQAQARGQITIALVGTIEPLNEQVTQTEVAIQLLFEAHPDQKIFASLPHSGNGLGGDPASSRSVTAGSGSLPTRAGWAAPSTAARRRRSGSRRPPEFAEPRC